VILADFLTNLRLELLDEAGFREWVVDFFGLDVSSLLTAALGGREVFFFNLSFLC